ncbi:MAG: uracil-DNA glycosylase [Thalassotalea sp.]
MSNASTDLTWQDFIAQEKKQPYLTDTLAYVEQQRAKGVTVYPQNTDVFSAFQSTAFQEVKVVIIGQDPYHGENQAHGLSFSVLPGVKPPPSLVNIYKELATDIDGFTVPEHGYLQPWAEQGVLLLNTVLTVEAGKAHSHKHLGWEQFTANVIERLNSQSEKLIFILWGAHAQKKGKSIDQDKHFVIQGPHPSPLSAYRGFFGCRHFSKTNEILEKLGKAPINWQV